jgi:hypothetical protein
MMMPTKRSATVIELRPRHVHGEASRSSARSEWIFLAGLCVVAFLLRFDFMREGGFVIDSDEAIVGLMARHIVEGGPVPTFYYGQHYMGALEPLCAAALFYLFGSSNVTLQLTPLLFSLALIILVYQLGLEVGGVVAGRVAALLCAVPPAALVVWSYKARGGFIELLVIGAWAMLILLRWLKTGPMSLRSPALISLLLGLGWWVNNQIIYFMAPIGAIGALYLLGSVRARQLSVFRLLAVLVVSAVCFFLGSAPYWIYNVARGFPSLGMFGFASPSEIGRYFVGLWTTALPIILGAKQFWDSDPSFSATTFATYLLYSLVFGGVVWSRRGSIAKLIKGEVDTQVQVEIFLILIVCVCAVFTVSTFGWLSQAPRYLLPIYVGLFVVCGLWASALFRVSAALGVVGVAALLGLNVSSCYWGGRALPGEPVVFQRDRVQRDHADLNRVLISLGISLVRTNYWIGYRLAFETGERIKFLVLQEPRQARIPEYERLPEGVSQDLVPLLLVPSERPLFVGALNLLGYAFEERRIGEYILFYNVKRPDLRLTPLAATEVVEVSGSGAQPARAALDGNHETRWGTGASQREGQSFEARFATPQSISAIEYDLGEWTQDYPRGLRIEIENARGEREVVLTNEHYQYLVAFWKGDTFRFWFSPRVAQRVILSQTGTHPILDWSIAELRFFTGSETTPVASTRGSEG